MKRQATAQWQGDLKAGKGTISIGALKTADPDEIAVSAIGLTGVAGPPTLVVR